MKQIKLIAISLLSTLAACQQGSGETELAGVAQGTTYHIKVVPRAGTVDLQALHREINAVLSDLDQKLSNYREDSEITQLNHQKTTDWLPVSKDIMENLVIAKDVYGKTSGCLDLTIKPLFDLWGFNKHENKIPTQAEIDRVLAHVGMEKIELDEAGLRLRKHDPETTIDLSSIGQGYTVGIVAKLLESKGIQDYMAEIGGEMKVKGRKANGDEWRIAIEKPTPFSREVQKIISIHQTDGEAVMTSGTYRNFFEEGGKTYSHILDPKSGKPVTHRLLSVTVFHNDPTWADAWDTALLCQGEVEGLKVAEANRLRVLFIFHDGQTLKELLTSEMAKTPDNP